MEQQIKDIEVQNMHLKHWKISFEVQNLTSEGCSKTKMTFKNILESAGPCLSGATRLRGVLLQSQVTGFLILNLYWFWQVTSLLILSGLKSAKLGFCNLLLCSLDKGFTTQHPGSRKSGCLWWDPEIHQNSKQSPIPQKSSNWCPKTPKSIQNEVQTGTWNR